MTEKEIQAIKEANRKFMERQSKKRYGVSTKNGGSVYAIEFENQEQAQEWLNTEEYDSRDRQIFNDLNSLCEEYPEFDCDDINDMLMHYNSEF